MEKKESLIIDLENLGIFKVAINNLEYKYGYAVVKIPQHALFRYSKEFIGVIDELGNIVVPFSDSIKEIDIFPSNNIVIKKVVREENSREEVGKRPHIIGREINHYRFIENSLEVVRRNLAPLYERINDNVIKLMYLNEVEECEEILYDVEYGEYISEPFTSIGSFEIRPNGEELAEAKVSVKSKYDGYEYNLIVYINKNGEIRPIMYNSYSDEIVPYYMWGDDYKTTLKNEKEKIDFKEQERVNRKEYAMQLFWNFKG